VSEPEIGPHGLPLPPREEPATPLPPRQEPGPATPAAAASPRRRRRDARLEAHLAALGLGFVALMCGGPLAGIPAVALGATGFARARPGSAARTQAMTGIVLGVLGSAMWTAIVLFAL
jgi:hypothetical protein